MQLQVHFLKTTTSLDVYVCAHLSRRVPAKTDAPGESGDCRGWPGASHFAFPSYQGTVHLLLSKGKRAFRKSERNSGSLQTHQLLLDLLRTSVELHVILMSQKASKNRQNIGWHQHLIKT